jgi:hypothetical protein
MALANYSDLQATALRWMERTGVDDAEAPDWIALAEARLNRELGAVETDATITGTVSSRRIDISSLSMVQPIALYLAEVGEDEVFITPKADGTFPYLDDSGRPSIWAVDGTNIDFDCPLDAAYPFRLRYREKFNLATASTNWLLTNHPDVYLAATLMWGAGYNEDWPSAPVWKSILDEAIPSIKNTIAQSKRSVSTVDAGLAMVGRSWRYGWDGTD